MSEPIAVARQATFNTDPADSETASGNSIRRGNIVIPIVEEDPKQDEEANLASSDRSSPIYANGDPNIKNYRLNALNSRFQRPTGPPSSHGDSSELEILSDVGLAGDSDTDVPPPLSLSASTRKKLRKEPRIKVPSAKFDSSEPTIEEETAQEILAARSPSISETDTDIIPDIRTTQIRSDTIVVSSPRKKSVSFNLTSDAPPHSPRVRGKPRVADSLSPRTRLKQQFSKKAANSISLQNDEAEESDKTVMRNKQSPQSVRANEVADPESSLCESDWQPSLSVKDPVKSPRSNLKILKSQPKKATSNCSHNGNSKQSEQVATDNNSGSTLENQKNKLTPRPIREQIERNETSAVNTIDGDSLNDSDANRTSEQVVENDKRIISNKYETDVKPAINTNKDTAEQQPAAEGTGSTAIKRQTFHSHEHQHACKLEPSIGSQIPNLRSHKPTGESQGGNRRADLAPQSLTIKQPRTPLISNLMEDVPGNETDVSAISDWNNDSVSGIPKKARFSKECGGSAEPDLVSTQAINPPPPPPRSPRMATSDGYDYESETFEEVLKERNAMVKAERTYQRRIKQLEDELKGMVNQCQLLSDENKELRKKLDSVKDSKEKSTVDNNTDSVELSSRIARLETEKENLVNTNDQLTTKLKEQEVKSKQWDLVFVENTKLKTKNAELERKIQSLEKQIDSLSVQAKESDTELVNKQQSANAQNQQIGELQYENKALKAQLKSLQNDNETLSITLEEKRKELSELMRAMQTETTTEAELSNSKVKLEKAQEEMDSVKKELEEMKNMLKESEENKNKLHGQISLRDSDLKKMKVDQDSKDNLINDLRKGLERAKHDIQKLEEEKNSFKDMEKETFALKSRIGSLKAEIESSLTENHKLKHDREDMITELERLRQDNNVTTEAILEGKKYFRKWENERETRNRVEVEISKKEDDIQILDGRLKEAGNKINVLISRVRALEDEKAQTGSATMQEVETNNKILKDENKKLRQMLVERNIELTNKRSEQQVIDTRIRVLERKQKDAEVRVHQLSGWVEDFDKTTSKDGKSEVTQSSIKTAKKGPVQHRHANVSQSATTVQAHNVSQRHQPHPHRSEKSDPSSGPQIAFVSPRSRKQGARRGNRSTLTPPPGWDESKRLRDGEGINTTPSSLPLILDTKSMTPPDPHGGYFMMYKEKMKRLQERRF